MKIIERRFVKPNLFCSKCITFEHCRWNSAIISSDRVETLKKFVDFHTNCPEVEIGLGIPRASLRLISQKGSVRLIQIELGKDHTDTMIKYTNNLISTMDQLDGFILKQLMKNPLPSQTPLKNTILAGHWTFPGGGIASVILSGYRASKHISQILK